MTDFITLKPIDVSEIQQQKKEIDPIEKNAFSLIIKTSSDYQEAGDLLKQVKGKINQLDSRRKSITAPIDLAKKSIIELFRQPIDSLTNIENHLKKSMISYTQEEEKKRREEEAKRQEQLRKEQEKLASKVQKLEEKGKVEQADLVKEQAAILLTQPIVLSLEPVKVSGISYRDKWSALIIDDSKIPREYLIPNVEALNKIAQATKGVLQIPGVEFKCEKIISSSKI